MNLSEYKSDMELIKITEVNGNKAVSARELHSFLESKQQFADWIKRRIDQYEFVEYQDFEVIHNSMNNPIGGRPFIEYALSVDMAKELSMVEGNEKGKMARRYFIECERVAKSGGFQVPTTFKEALLLAAQQQEQIEVQQKQIKLMKPKEEFFDTVTGSKDACDMATTAKVLNMGVGRNTLFEILRDNKILQGNNQPMQRYVDAGWFRVVETQFTKKSGDISINFKTIVYQKGIDGIRKVVLTHLNKKGNEDRN